MFCTSLIIKVIYESVQDGTIILHLSHITFFNHLGKIKLGSTKKIGKNIDLHLPDLASKIIGCQGTFKFYINHKYFFRYKYIPNITWGNLT